MLHGVRVIDVGTTITAPLAAMLLADLGADVIKVERPEGDPFRSFRGGKYGPHFAAYNRGKRSVVIDLTTDTGQTEMADIVAGADVLIDNFRPGVLHRLGLAPDALRVRNPRLIHCSITGFGATGPDRDRPAYDGVAQAISGISSLFLDPNEPKVAGPTISDNVTGMYAAYGIVGALFERERTGAGRRLEVNMLEASMAFIPDAFTSVTQLGMHVDPYTRTAASQSYAFRCADGLLVAIHLSSLEKFWTGLLAALHAMELGSDPRFAERMGRVNNYLVLRDELQARFIRRPRGEWLERLRAADIPFAAVNTIEQTIAEPQIAALGSFGTFVHPSEGALTFIHSPILVDGERITAPLPPPVLGEHTAELLPGG
jgi:crotonobetainyl-CoA:carnitine CoA-transferase CaiB-like acyl-CoA transferase